MSDDMSLTDWLQERADNCRRIAKTKNSADRAGWMEDLQYFLRAKSAVDALIAASSDEANCPLRMNIALHVMRAWNHGTVGFSADVVATINAWIDDGMKGPIPWPSNPFFAEWAESAGYAKVGDYIGFRFKARIVEDGR